jgi:hypothetical protein
MIGIGMRMRIGMGRGMRIGMVMRMNGMSEIEIEIFF